ncbi:very short patch repair endonuclease [Saccharospirillum alexandrii]|uniref:very short patch repair endonuclease n=1 Tax=Saccharospirillum alexandrii TaxID=2448477 RepID=UPI003734CCE0
MDIVNKQTRSRYMSGIRSKNTRPEVSIRKELHRRGYRYRLHSRKLPGKPDVVLTKYRTVVLVNGCFWHMHGCKLFKLPQTRTDFWREKLEGNVKRDLRNKDLLNQSGWRVFVVWECGVKIKKQNAVEQAVDAFETWLDTECMNGEYPADS